MEKERKIIIICGPTATGKTDLAIKLAEKIGGEIISADSQQVYKGLEIGTAKPSPEELKRVRHHLVSIVQPNESFNVNEFVKLADSAIEDISGRGLVPLVVGGTGLYIKALCYGLAEAPQRDEEYREELESIKNREGVAGLYKMLQKIDLKTAEKLKAGDTQRIIRALEVFHITGRPLSLLQKEHSFAQSRYSAVKIGLAVDRKELYKRIDARVDKMIAGGLFEETKALVERYGKDCQAFKAVGYKEIIEAGSDKLSSETVELIKRNTRRYAKRQLTWFRADKEIKWFSPDDEKGILSIIK